MDLNSRECACSERLADILRCYDQVSRSSQCLSRGELVMSENFGVERTCQIASTVAGSRQGSMVVGETCSQYLPMPGKTMEVGPSEAHVEFAEAPGRPGWQVAEIQEK